jgi:hypothetical protein
LSRGKSPLIVFVNWRDFDFVAGTCRFHGPLRGRGWLAAD